MKLVSYLNDGHDQLAVLVDGFLYDMGNLHPDLPNNMSMFLQYWEDAYPMALGGEMMIREGKLVNDTAVPVESVELLAPVPFPSSLRDGYSFRQRRLHEVVGSNEIETGSPHCTDLRVHLLR